MSNKLTHLNQTGEAHMVDVSNKNITQRTATAQTIVQTNKQVIDAVIEGNNKKGDVISAVRIAGIQAAKKCAELIPLCHPLMLTHIDIDINIDQCNHRITIHATCGLDGKTGVEMESLTAASVAALTFYDMCKSIDKGIVIEQTKLIKKTGGKSGDWSCE